MSPHAMPPLPPSTLFSGLADEELKAVAEQMRPREFGVGERICTAGEPSDRLWLITGGLVHILAGHSDAAAGEVVARQRKGDVVGAQGAVTGEPRTATVVAALPTSAMELDGERFLELAQRYPAILVNLIRIQSERLVIANARRVEHERGETVALLSSPALAATATRVAELAQRVSPRPVIWLDRRLSFAGTLTAADDLTDEHATVLLPGELDPETMTLLLDEVDRVVALVGSARDAERLGALARDSKGRGAQVEIVLLGEEAVAASREWPAGAPIRVVRTCPRGDHAGQAPGSSAMPPPMTTPGSPPQTEPGPSPAGRMPPPTRLAGAPPHPHQAGARAGRRRREGVCPRGRAAGAGGGRLRGGLCVGQQHRRDRRRLRGARDGRRGDRRHPARRLRRRQRGAAVQNLDGRQRRLLGPGRQ